MNGINDESMMTEIVREITSIKNKGEVYLLPSCNVGMMKRSAVVTNCDVGNPERE